MNRWVQTGALLFVSVLVAGSFLGIAHLAAASTPSISWQQQSPSAPLPPARDSAAMAYDAADGEMVMFGGESVSGSTATCFSDTWTYSGGTWTQVTTSPSPTARWGASMVYDAADGYVVLFGGGCNGQGYLGDTWEFHKGAWTELNPATSPPAREYAGMAYDAADGYVLLFGGNSQTTVGGTTANVTYGDTWEFKAGVWTQLPITAGTGPSARTWVTMCYDSSYGKVLMFGGALLGSTTTVYADTWVYSGGGWSQLTSSGPSARAGVQMDYLPSISGDVLFGGVGFTGGGQATTLQDTWVFSSGTWSQVTVSPSPAGRAFGSMAYDGQSSGIFLFGGFSYTGTQVVDDSDSWQLNGPAPPPATTPQVLGIPIFEFLLIVAVVAVILIILVALVVVRSRRHAPAAPPAAPASSYGAAPPGPYPMSSPSYPPGPAPPTPPTASAPPPAYPPLLAAAPTSPSPPAGRSLFCPRCGATTAADAAFCPKCGRALPPPTGAR